jgi:hypothetical protein
MQDNVDAITQIATSMASDSGTVATLATTNAKLAMQLDAAQAYIKTLNEEVFVPKAKIKLTWQGQCPMKSTSNHNY